jgi:hypothetical protein
MQPPDPKEIAKKYPLIAWLDDFEFLSKSAAVGQPQLAPQILQDRFYDKHPDDPNADENARRLLAAFYFVGRHLEELDAGGVVVIGSSADLISNPLSAVIYRVFMSVGVEQLDWEVDVSWILNLVDEQKKYMESGETPKGPN